MLLEFLTVERIGAGLPQLMALCKKYNLNHIERGDIISLNKEKAARGNPTHKDNGT